MKRNLLLNFILLFLLLNFFTQITIIKGQDSITFSEGVDFDYSNVIGSDGEDYLMATAVDDEGNVSDEIEPSKLKDAKVIDSINWDP